MGDEFDGCEYHFAISRLLHFIRQSQNLCSDTQCIDVSGRMLQRTTVPSPGENDDTNFTMMTMFMILAVIMYFIRPQSIMKLTNTKRSAGGQDPHGPPSPPPPPAPPAIH